MTTAKDVMKMIKENDVKYVDFRFTDPRGKWQHVTFDVTMIEDDTFAEGVMFDGSSIAGWKAINESDMCLMPDPATACIDPFFAETTLVLVCDVLEPTTGEPYNRDPRGIAKKAEAMVKSMGIGDTVYFGPEAEFFVFDDVKFRADPYNTGFKLDSIELPTNSDADYESGNLGHRIGIKKGYFPVPPQDSAQDMRGEMLASMAKMGAKIEKHHHEVASAQHELGLKFSPMTYMADQTQIYKYCIHQVANIYGKTATFMPKPVYGDNGSGMHCHQSIWKDGKPVFAGNKYSDLSETCLHIHRRRHQAREGHQRFHQPDDELLQASGSGLRSAGAARLLRAQPLGLVPHPLHHQSEGQARRSSLPRSACQSVSRLCRAADGRSRWHQEQDGSWRSHGQGSLRSAPGELKEIPTVVRLAA